MPIRLLSHRFYIRHRQVDVTPHQFALVSFLMARADSLCTRDEILEHVWGIAFDTGTNMVDVYMHFLRRKFEASGLKNMLQTVRGHGYRLVLPPSDGEWH